MQSQQQTSTTTVKRSSSTLVVVAVALLFGCIRIVPTSALQCYTCSYIESETDDACVKDANATESITNCTKKYCTIMRQEAKHPAGKVISFIRDCLDKPLFLNKVIEDETFKTFYRSCSSDLCNDSDGRHSSGSVDPSLGAAPNMIIKGKDTAAAMQNVQLGVALLGASVMAHLFM